jgi:hypothetical protein
MNFLRDGILQFIYPRKHTCALCGQSVPAYETAVCGACYLELIWSADGLQHEYGDLLHCGQEKRRVKAVAEAKGRMKQLLMLLRSEPEAQILDLAVRLLIAKAGAWLGEAQYLTILTESENVTGDLDRKLIAGFSERTKIPYIDTSRVNTKLQRSPDVMNVLPKGEGMYITTILPMDTRYVPMRWDAEHRVLALAVEAKE